MSERSDFKTGRNAPSSAVIILDESGDLGFSPLRSSRHFVVAATIVHEPNDFDRLAKSARNKLGKQKIGGELKFNKSTDPIKRHILRGIANIDCQIVWISIEKDMIPMRMRKDKDLLYQMACEVVLREAVKRTSAQKIHIIIDKHLPKRKDRERSERHIMSIIAREHAGHFIPRINISQYDSLTSPELQVHDFVVGAIFQHIERGVDAYIHFIERKIVFGQRHL